MRSHHEKGNNTAGLNVFTGKVVDMWEKGVVEPLRVKTQAIDSATEAWVAEWKEWIKRGLPSSIFLI